MHALADTHVHLLAGLDDGPRDLAESLEMCRMLVAQGVRHATALAHQNDDYPDNHADRLRLAANELKAQLQQQNIPLTVYPTGEIRLSPTIVEDWQAGKLLSVGDHKRVLLVEMPWDMFIDIRPLTRTFQQLGVRLMIAHAERYPEMLQQPELVDELVSLGCLIQITAERIADPQSRTEEKALKSWAKRGLIHVLGSDGHRSSGQREPRFEAGFQQLAKWTDDGTAARIAGLCGMTVLQGVPMSMTPKLPPPPRSWLSRWFSG